jgi:hypothetical protein
MASTFRRNGRPSKLNSIVAMRIYREVIGGNTQAVACAQAGIEVKTAQNWSIKGQGHDNECNFELWQCSQECGEIAAFRRFFLNLKKASLLWQRPHVKNIRKASNDPRLWMNSMTMLERRDPQNWGRRDRIDVSGEISTVRKGESKHITPEQKRRMARTLLSEAEYEEDMQRLAASRVVRQIEAPNGIQDAVLVETPLSEPTSN